MMRGVPMGEFGPGDPDLPPRDRGQQAWMFSLHKTCPLCGVEICNDATTCRDCRQEWKRRNGDADGPSSQEQMLERHRFYEAKRRDEGWTIADVIADIEARKQGDA